MAFDRELFDFVRTVVEGTWPCGPTDDISAMTGGDPTIIGKTDNLLFEINAQVFFDGMPVVRTFTDFARYVPDTDDLQVRLLQLNGAIPATTLGTVSEENAAQTVAVRASSAVFGRMANEETINACVRDCLSAATLLLNGGFISLVGGELGHDVYLREMNIAL